MDCFWELNGGAEWSANKTVNGINGYRAYAEEAQKSDLVAGGMWSRLKDWPHVQLRGASSPRSDLSWVAIDRAMQERFDVTRQAPLLARPAGATELEVVYASPHGWRIWRTTDEPGCLFRAGMTICADGCSRAYHPAGSPPGLDYLANAGRPGNWWAIVADASGEPIIQGATDPSPGFYVSTTALVDPDFAPADPRRYVDAATIPYVVLPGGDQIGRFHAEPRLRLGDFAVVHNLANQQLAYAICAEIGPADKVGEGSMALAQALAVPDDPKRGGTAKRDLIYLVFPGTGEGHPRPRAEIEKLAKAAFLAWGGMGRLAECTAALP
jgi:hypothetical protein